MRKLQFVRFNKMNINPWAVANIEDEGDHVLIWMINRKCITVPKHVGGVIVNDLKAVTSALELAANEVNDNE